MRKNLSGLFQSKAVRPDRFLENKDTVAFLRKTIIVGRRMENFGILFLLEKMLWRMTGRRLIVAGIIFPKTEKWKRAGFWIREDIIIWLEMVACSLGSGFWIRGCGTSWEKTAVCLQISGFLREENGIFSIRMEAIMQTSVHKDIKSDTMLLKRNKKLIFYFINDFALFWRKYGFDRYYRVFGFW